MSVDAVDARFYEGAPTDGRELTVVEQQWHNIGTAATGGVVFFGAGDNFDNMREAAIELSSHHPVYLVEWKKEPDFPVPRWQKFLVADDSPENDTLHALLDSGKVDIGYISLPPDLHEKVAEEHTARIGEGALKYLICTKPVVPDIRAFKRLITAINGATERRRVTRPGEDDPIFYVHEHYREKGPWKALREQLPELTDRLGRLRKFVVNIEETQAIEEEHRGLDAFGDAIGDFAPHIVSLAFDAKDAINLSSRYEFSNSDTTETRALRYQGTELPEGVPTGFITRGKTSIVDKVKGSEHDVEFVWRAGKGLGTEDSKYAILEFEHPDTGVVSTVTVDLRNGTLQIPDADGTVTTTKYEENGYGPIVFDGLNGGHPRNSFQPLEQAYMVAKWASVLKRQAAQAARELKQIYQYDRRHNFTLRNLEESVFSQEASK